ncbi:MAG: hypothetical protein HY259_03675 [Chloroflexi bacterium]|nr:hypothetical protein [Chloroflexota bacterium]
MSSALCSHCGQSLDGRATFLLGGQRHCLNGALRYAPLVRRSALTPD